MTCLSLQSSCLFCVQEVAASYSFGAVGSLIYLRLLNRSVDSVGGFSVGAALGQPRLLIPMILTAAYNRWACLIHASARDSAHEDKLAAPYPAPEARVQSKRLPHTDLREGSLCLAADGTPWLHTTQASPFNCCPCSWASSHTRQLSLPRRQSHLQPSSCQLV